MTREIHIAIFEDDAPNDELYDFLEAVADVVMGFEQRTGWDPHLSATGFPHTRGSEGSQP